MLRLPWRGCVKICSASSSLHRKNTRLDIHLADRKTRLAFLAGLMAVTTAILLAADGSAKGRPDPPLGLGRGLLCQGDNFRGCLSCARTEALGGRNG